MRSRVTSIAFILALVISPAACGDGRTPAAPIGRPSATSPSPSFTPTVTGTVQLEDQLDVLLTNDDPDYGDDGDEAFNLPGKRGPVKVIVLKSPTDGPIELDATWPGPDKLEMWIERRYRELSIQATSAPDRNALHSSVPAGWANDAVVTVGLRGPRGLLSGPTPIHLSLTPRP